MVHKRGLARPCKPLWTPYGECVCVLHAWMHGLALSMTAPHRITSHKTQTHVRKHTQTHTYKGFVDSSFQKVPYAIRFHVWRLSGSCCNTQDTNTWNCKIHIQVKTPNPSNLLLSSTHTLHPCTQAPHSTAISLHTQQLLQNKKSFQSSTLVSISPCRSCDTTDTTLYSPDPDCEAGSGGEHNCMLKRLRNGRPVLLSWCFLCGLIVGTCSHAALWVPVGAHVGLGVVQNSGRGGNVV